MSCTTVRRAPITSRCASPSFCQWEMPTAMSMRPPAHARSNQDTSRMERLAMAALSTKGSIGLSFGIEKSPYAWVGRVPEHVGGAAHGHDTPAFQYDGHIAGTACLGL